MTVTGGSGTKLVTASNISGDQKICVSDPVAKDFDGMMGFVNVV
jgi:hypothetical protein